MGKLLDLAKALAGEKSLHSALGRWIQAVSLALDGGSAAPDYGIVGKGAALAVIGVGDALPLDAPGLIRGVQYSTGTSLWTLTPGKTYRLTAVGFFRTFSDGTGGLLDIQWIDANGNVLSSGGLDSPTVRFRPATCTDADSSAAGLEMIYRVPAGDPLAAQVQLSCSNATGTAQMPEGSWTAIVQEIPG